MDLDQLRKQAEGLKAQAEREMADIRSKRYFDDAGKRPRWPRSPNASRASSKRCG